jgi:peptidoglycan DL-endopeptidase CwlO
VPHHPGPFFASAGRRQASPLRRRLRLVRLVLPATGSTVLVMALAAGATAELAGTVRAPAQAGARAATRAAGAASAGEAGVSRSAAFSGFSGVPVSQVLTAMAGPQVSPLGRAHQPDVMIVGQHPLPSWALGAVKRAHGVAAAESVDAARIQVNGRYVAMLGVDPSTFRGFAAHPTAASDELWQNVAAGAMAVSYTMGSQDHLPLGGSVQVAGAHQPQSLKVGGFGTVGIGGIDTVVSRQTAARLGLPSGNAIVVSAAHGTDVASLTSSLKKAMPQGTTVQPLVPVVTSRWVRGQGSQTGQSGQAGGTQNGSALSAQQVSTMLNAALSRQGMPYVWGATGPGSFDCSGLVQWSFAQAGIAMPRVAADQALTGPSVSQLQPGDLLFWHTDPTAPDYISHVAIYLGNGRMIQAPQPGQNVEVVPVSFGSGFAGAVQVEPQVAGSVPG